MVAAPDLWQDADETAQARLVDDYTRSLAARLAAHEDALAGLLAMHFDRAERVALDKLTGAKNRSRWGVEDKRLAVRDIWNPVAWAQALLDDFGSWLRAVFGDVGGDIARRLDIDWTVADAAVAMARQAERLDSIAETTAEAIDRALTGAQDDGDGIDMAADAVRDVFDTARTSRARTIATTETFGAAGAAVQSVATAAPFPVQKRWWSMLDDRVRPTHVAAHGQTVPVGDLFEVGADELEFPGDPAGALRETIRCRCVMLLVPSAVAAKTTPAIWSGSGARRPAGARRPGQAVEVKAGAVGRTRAAYRAHIARRRNLGMPIPSVWWARAGMDPGLAESSRRRRPQITEPTRRAGDRAALRAVDRFARADGPEAPDVPESRLFSRSEKAAFGAFTETWNRLTAQHVDRTGGQPSAGQRSWITRQANQAAAEAVRRSDGRALIVPTSSDPESDWARDLKAAIDRMHTEAPQADWFKTRPNVGTWERLTPGQRVEHARLTAATVLSNTYYGFDGPEQLALINWRSSALVALADNPDAKLPKYPVDKNYPESSEAARQRDTFDARSAAALLRDGYDPRAYEDFSPRRNGTIAIKVEQAFPDVAWDPVGAPGVRSITEHVAAVHLARLEFRDDPPIPDALVAAFSEDDIEAFTNRRWDLISDGLDRYQRPKRLVAAEIPEADRADRIPISVGTILTKRPDNGAVYSDVYVDSPNGKYMRATIAAVEAHLTTGKPLKAARRPRGVDDARAEQIQAAVLQAYRSVDDDPRFRAYDPTVPKPDEASFRREAEIRAIGQSVLDRAAERGPERGRSAAMMASLREWTPILAADTDKRPRERRAWTRRLELTRQVEAELRMSLGIDSEEVAGFRRGPAFWNPDGYVPEEAVVGGKTYRASVRFITSRNDGGVIAKRALVDTDGRVYVMQEVGPVGAGVNDDGFGAFTEPELVDEPGLAAQMRVLFDEIDMIPGDEMSIDYMRRWASENGASRDALTAALAEIREMGGQPPVTTYDMDAIRSIKAHNLGTAWEGPEAEAALNESLSRIVGFYPREWTEAVNRTFPDLKTGVVERGFAARTGVFATSPEGRGAGGWGVGQVGASGALDSTSLHELGHFMEYSVPGLKAAEWTFWHRRTNSDVAGVQKLGHRYEAHEVAHADEFENAYIGKVYANSPDTNWEVFSMGVEAAFGFRPSADMDHVSFTLGLLATLRGVNPGQTVAGTGGANATTGV